MFAPLALVFALFAVILRIGHLFLPLKHLVKRKRLCLLHLFLLLFLLQSLRLLEVVHVRVLLVEQVFKTLDLFLGCVVTSPFLFLKSDKKGWDWGVNKMFKYFQTDSPRQRLHNFGRNLFISRILGFFVEIKEWRSITYKKSLSPGILVVLEVHVRDFFVFFPSYHSLYYCLSSSDFLYFFSKCRNTLSSCNK